MSAILKYDNKNVSIDVLSEQDIMHINYFSKGSFYELKLLNKIKSFEKSGVYIDLGANVGNHSLFFGLFCPVTKVIAIEAEKNIFNVLHNNLLRNLDNNKFVTYNCAISDFDGFVSMSLVSNINAGSTHISEINNGDTKCTTLDNLIGDLNDIAVIKMDIEGYELKALTKATKIIENNKPIIITEVKNNNEFNDLKFFLGKYGYTCDAINYANTPTYIWVA